MKIIDKSIDDIHPYEKNPRINDNAVDSVAESIKQFGFKVPIVIDKDGVIVTGHTRLKAAKKLGMKTVPCILADDLTPAQVKAFRLADNKTGELADWDFSELEDELTGIEDIDMKAFGFSDNLDDLNVEDFFKETPGSAEETDADDKTVTCPYCGKKFPLK